jgi:hypothetical protein
LQRTLLRLRGPQRLCYPSPPQAMPKLKAFEAAMVDHFEAHRARAGLGLQLLPGVERLLQALKVRARRAGFWGRGERRLVDDGAGAGNVHLGVWVWASVLFSPCVPSATASPPPLLRRAVSPPPIHARLGIRLKLPLPDDGALTPSNLPKGPRRRAHLPRDWQPGTHRLGQGASKMSIPFAPSWSWCIC